MIHTYRKHIAIAVIICFIAQSVAYSAPSLSLPETSALPVMEKPAKVLSFSIPASLGQVEKVHEAAGSKSFIIHISDAHGNPEAQENIRRIIRHLVKTYGIKTLFLEGGHGKLRPECVQFVTDQKLNRSIQHELVRQGELSGAEEALSQEGLEGFGIEDVENYRTDLDLFRHVIREEENSKKILEKWEDQLRAAEARFASKDLRSFLKEWRDHSEGKASLSHFLGILSLAAQKQLSLDLGSSDPQWEYPVLVRMEKLFHADKVLQERSDAVAVQKKALMEFLLKKKVSPLLMKKVEHLDVQKWPRHVLERLDETLEGGIDFKDYPDWALYAQYFIFRSEIDAKKLFQELERLIRKVLFRLAVSKKEKDLVRFYLRGESLYRLLSLELERGEYFSVQRRMKKGLSLSPASFAAKMEELSGVSPEKKDVALLEKRFVTALRFYSKAVERENDFLRNISTRLLSPLPVQAVVVTGGFHEKGLKELLLSEDISYAEIKPRMREEIGESLSVYKAAMLGREADRSQISNVLQTMTLEEQAAMGALKGSRLREVAKAVQRALVRQKRTLDSELVDQLARSPYAAVNGLTVIRGEGNLLEFVPARAASLGGDDDFLQQAVQEARGLFQEALPQASREEKLAFESLLTDLETLVFAVEPMSYLSAMEEIKGILSDGHVSFWGAEEVLRLIAEIARAEGKDTSFSISYLRDMFRSSSAHLLAEDASEGEAFKKKLLGSLNQMLPYSAGFSLEAIGTVKDILNTFYGFTLRPSGTVRSKMETTMSAGEWLDLLNDFLKVRPAATSDEMGQVLKDLRTFTRFKAVKTFSPEQTRAWIDLFKKVWERSGNTAVFLNVFGSVQNILVWVEKDYETRSELYSSEIQPTLFDIANQFEGTAMGEAFAKLYGDLESSKTGRPVYEIRAQSLGAVNEAVKLFKSYLPDATSEEEKLFGEIMDVLRPVENAQDGMRNERVVLEIMKLLDSGDILSQDKKDALPLLKKIVAHNWGSQSAEVTALSKLLLYSRENPRQREDLFRLMSEILDKAASFEAEALTELKRLLDSVGVHELGAETVFPFLLLVPAAAQRNTKDVFTALKDLWADPALDTEQKKKLLPFLEEILSLTGTNAGQVIPALAKNLVLLAANGALSEEMTALLRAILQPSKQMAFFAYQTFEQLLKQILASGLQKDPEIYLLLSELIRKKEGQLPQAFVQLSPLFDKRVMGKVKEESRKQWLEVLLQVIERSGGSLFPNLKVLFEIMKWTLQGGEEMAVRFEEKTLPQVAAIASQAEGEGMLETLQALSLSLNLGTAEDYSVSGASLGDAEEIWDAYLREFPEAADGSELNVFGVPVDQEAIRVRLQENEEKLNELMDHPVLSAESREQIFPLILALIVKNADDQTAPALDSLKQLLDSGFLTAANQEEIFQTVQKIPDEGRERTDVILQEFTALLGFVSSTTFSLNEILLLAEIVLEKEKRFSALGLESLTFLLKDPSMTQALWKRIHKHFFPVFQISRAKPDLVFGAYSSLLNSAAFNPQNALKLIPLFSDLLTGVFENEGIDMTIQEDLKEVLKSSHLDPENVGEVFPLMASIAPYAGYQSGKAFRAVDEILGSAALTPENREVVFDTILTAAEKGGMNAEHVIRGLGALLRREDLSAGQLTPEVFADLQTWAASLMEVSKNDAFQLDLTVESFRSLEALLLSPSFDLDKRNEIFDSFLGLIKKISQDATTENFNGFSAARAFAGSSAWTAEDHAEAFERFWKSLEFSRQNLDDQYHAGYEVFERLAKSTAFTSSSYQEMLRQTEQTVSRLRGLFPKDSSGEYDVFRALHSWLDSDWVTEENFAEILSAYEQLASLMKTKTDSPDGLFILLGAFFTSDLSRTLAVPVGEKMMEWLVKTLRRTDGESFSQILSALDSIKVWVEQALDARKAVFEGQIFPALIDYSNQFEGKELEEAIVKLNNGLENTPSDYDLKLKGSAASLGALDDVWEAYQRSFPWEFRGDDAVGIALRSTIAYFKMIPERGMIERLMYSPALTPASRQESFPVLLAHIFQYADKKSSEALQALQNILDSPLLTAKNQQKVFEGLVNSTEVSGDHTAEAFEAFLKLLESPGWKAVPEAEILALLPGLAERSRYDVEKVFDALKGFLGSSALNEPLWKELVPGLHYVLEYYSIRMDIVFQAFQILIESPAFDPKEARVLFGLFAKFLRLYFENSKDYNDRSHLLGEMKSLLGNPKVKAGDLRDLVLLLGRVPPRGKHFSNDIIHAVVDILNSSSVTGESFALMLKRMRKMIRTAGMAGKEALTGLNSILSRGDLTPEEKELWLNDYELWARRIMEKTTNERGYSYEWDIFKLLDTAIANGLFSSAQRQEYFEAFLKLAETTVKVSENNSYNAFDVSRSMLVRSKDLDLKDVSGLYEEFAKTLALIRKIFGSSDSVVYEALEKVAGSSILTAQNYALVLERFERFFQDVFEQDGSYASYRIFQAFGYLAGAGWISSENFEELWKYFEELVKASLSRSPENRDKFFEALLYVLPTDAYKGMSPEQGIRSLELFKSIVERTESEEGLRAIRAVSEMADFLRWEKKNSEFGERVLPALAAIVQQTEGAELADEFGKFYQELKRPTKEEDFELTEAQSLGQERREEKLIAIFRTAIPELTPEEDARLWDLLKRNRDYMHGSVQPARELFGSEAIEKIDKKRLAFYIAERLPKSSPHSGVMAKSLKELFLSSSYNQELQEEIFGYLDAIPGPAWQYAGHAINALAAFLSSKEFKGLELPLQKEVLRRVTEWTPELGLYMTDVLSAVQALLGSAVWDPLNRETIFQEYADLIRLVKKEQVNYASTGISVLGAWTASVLARPERRTELWEEFKELFLLFAEHVGHRREEERVFLSNAFFNLREKLLRAPGFEWELWPYLYPLLQNIAKNSHWSSDQAIMLLGRLLGQEAFKELIREDPDRLFNYMNRFVELLRGQASTAFHLISVYSYEDGPKMTATQRWQWIDLLMTAFSRLRQYRLHEHEEQYYSISWILNDGLLNTVKEKGLNFGEEVLPDLMAIVHQTEGQDMVNVLSKYSADLKEGKRELGLELRQAASLGTEEQKKEWERKMPEIFAAVLPDATEDEKDLYGKVIKQFDYAGSDWYAVSAYQELEKIFRGYLSIYRKQLLRILSPLLGRSEGQQYAQVLSIFQKVLNSSYLTPANAQQVFNDFQATNTFIFDYGGSFSKYECLQAFSELVASSSITEMNQKAIFSDLKQIPLKTGIWSKNAFKAVKAGIEAPFFLEKPEEQEEAAQAIYELVKEAGGRYLRTEDLAAPLDALVNFFPSAPLAQGNWKEALPFVTGLIKGKNYRRDGIISTAQKIIATPAWTDHRETVGKISVFLLQARDPNTDGGLSAFSRLLGNELFKKRSFDEQKEILDFLLSIPVDAYSSSVESLQNAMDMLVEVAEKKGMKIATVLDALKKAASFTGDQITRVAFIVLRGLKDDEQINEKNYEEILQKILWLLEYAKGDPYYVVASYQGLLRYPAVESQDRESLWRSFVSILEAIPAREKKKEKDDETYRALYFLMHEAAFRELPMEKTLVYLQLLQTAAARSGDLEILKQIYDKIEAVMRWVNADKEKKQERLERLQTQGLGRLAEIVNQTEGEEMVLRLHGYGQFLASGAEGEASSDDYALSVGASSLGQEDVEKIQKKIRNSFNKNFGKNSPFQPLLEEMLERVNKYGEYWDYAIYKETLSLFDRYPKATATFLEGLLLFINGNVKSRAEDISKVLAFVEEVLAADLLPKFPEALLKSLLARTQTSDPSLLDPFPVVKKLYRLYQEKNIDKDSLRLFIGSEAFRQFKLKGKERVLDMIANIISYVEFPYFHDEYRENLERLLLSKAFQAVPVKDREEIYKQIEELTVLNFGTGEDIILMIQELLGLPEGERDSAYEDLKEILQTIMDNNDFQEDAEARDGLWTAMDKVIRSPEELKEEEYVSLMDFLGAQKFEAYDPALLDVPFIKMVERSGDVTQRLRVLTAFIHIHEALDEDPGTRGPVYSQYFVTRFSGIVNQFEGDELAAKLEKFSGNWYDQAPEPGDYELGRSSGVSLGEEPQKMEEAFYAVFERNEENRAFLEKLKAAIQQYSWTSNAYGYEKLLYNYWDYTSYFRKLTPRDRKNIEAYKKPFFDFLIKIASQSGLVRGYLGLIQRLSGARFLTAENAGEVLDRVYQDFILNLNPPITGTGSILIGHLIGKDVFTVEEWQEEFDSLLAAIDLIKTRLSPNEDYDLHHVFSLMSGIMFPSEAEEKADGKKYITSQNWRELLDQLTELLTVTYKGYFNRHKQNVWQQRSFFEKAFQGNPISPGGGTRLLLPYRLRYSWLHLARAIADRVSDPKDLEEILPAIAAIHNWLLDDKADYARKQEIYDKQIFPNLSAAIQQLEGGEMLRAVEKIKEETLTAGKDGEGSFSLEQAQSLGAIDDLRRSFREAFYNAVMADRATLERAIQSIDGTLNSPASREAAFVALRVMIENAKMDLEDVPAVLEEYHLLIDTLQTYSSFRIEPVLKLLRPLLAQVKLSSTNHTTVMKALTVAAMQGGGSVDQDYEELTRYMDHLGLAVREKTELVFWVFSAYLKKNENFKIGLGDFLKEKELVLLQDILRSKTFQLWSRSSKRNWFVLMRQLTAGASDWESALKIYTLMEKLYRWVEKEFPARRTVFGKKIHPELLKISYSKKGDELLTALNEYISALTAEPGQGSSLGQEQKIWELFGRKMPAADAKQKARLRAALRAVEDISVPEAKEEALRALAALIDSRSFRSDLILEDFTRFVRSIQKNVSQNLTKIYQELHQFVIPPVSFSIDQEKIFELLLVIPPSAKEGTKEALKDLNAFMFRPQTWGPWFEIVKAVPQIAQANTDFAYESLALLLYYYKDELEIEQTQLARIFLELIRLFPLSDHDGTKAMSLLRKYFKDNVMHSFLRILRARLFTEMSSQEKKTVLELLLKIAVRTGREKEDALAEVFGSILSLLEWASVNEANAVSFKKEIGPSLIAAANQLEGTELKTAVQGIQRSFVRDMKFDDYEFAGSSLGKERVLERFYALYPEPNPKEKRTFERLVALIERFPAPQSQIVFETIGDLFSKALVLNRRNRGLLLSVLVSVARHPTEHLNQSYDRLERLLELRRFRELPHKNKEQVLRLMNALAQHAEKDSEKAFRKFMPLADSWMTKAEEWDEIVSLLMTIAKYARRNADEAMTALKTLLEAGFYKQFSLEEKKRFLLGLKDLSRLTMRSTDYVFEVLKGYMEFNRAQGFTPGENLEWLGIIYLLTSRGGSLNIVFKAYKKIIRLQEWTEKDPGRKEIYKEKIFPHLSEMMNQLEGEEILRALDEFRAQLETGTLEGDYGAVASAMSVGSQPLWRSFERVFPAASKEDRDVLYEIQRNWRSGRYNQDEKKQKRFQGFLANLFNTMDPREIKQNRQAFTLAYQWRDKEYSFEERMTLLSRLMGPKKFSREQRALIFKMIFRFMDADDSSNAGELVNIFDRFLQGTFWAEKDWRRVVGKFQDMMVLLEKDRIVPQNTRDGFNAVKRFTQEKLFSKKEWEPFLDEFLNFLSTGHAGRKKYSWFYHLWQSIRFWIQANWDDKLFADEMIKSLSYGKLGHVPDLLEGFERIDRRKLTAANWRRMLRAYSDLASYIYGLPPEKIQPAAKLASEILSSDILPRKDYQKIFEGTKALIRSHLSYLGKDSSRELENLFSYPYNLFRGNTPEQNHVFLELLAKIGERTGNPQALHSIYVQLDKIFSKRYQGEGLRRIQQEVLPRLAELVNQLEGEELAAAVREFAAGFESGLPPSEYETAREAASLGKEDVWKVFDAVFPEADEQRKKEFRAILEEFVEPYYVIEEQKHYKDLKLFLLALRRDFPVSIEKREKTLDLLHRVGEGQRLDLGDYVRTFYQILRSKRLLPEQKETLLGMIEEAVSFSRTEYGDWNNWLSSFIKTDFWKLSDWRKALEEVNALLELIRLDRATVTNVSNLYDIMEKFFDSGAVRGGRWHAFISAFTDFVALGQGGMKKPDPMARMRQEIGVFLAKLRSSGWDVKKAMEYDEKMLRYGFGRIGHSDSILRGIEHIPNRAFTEENWEPLLRSYIELAAFSYGLGPEKVWEAGQVLMTMNGFLVTANNYAEVFKKDRTFLVSFEPHLGTSVFHSFYHIHLMNKDAFRGMSVNNFFLWLDFLRVYAERTGAEDQKEAFGLLEWALRSGNIKEGAFSSLAVLAHQFEGKELITKVEKFLKQPAPKASEYELSPRAASLGEEELRQAIEKNFPEAGFLVKMQIEEIIELVREYERTQTVDDPFKKMWDLQEVFERLGALKDAKEKKRMVAVLLATVRSDTPRWRIFSDILERRLMGASVSSEEREAGLWVFEKAISLTEELAHIAWFLQESLDVDFWKEKGWQEEIEKTFRLIEKDRPAGEDSEKINNRQLHYRLLSIFVQAELVPSGRFNEFLASYRDFISPGSSEPTATGWFSGWRDWFSRKGESLSLYGKGKHSLTLLDSLQKAIRTLKAPDWKDFLKNYQELASYVYQLPSGKMKLAVSMVSVLTDPELRSEKISADFPREVLSILQRMEKYLDTTAGIRLAGTLENIRSSFRFTWKGGLKPVLPWFEMLFLMTERSGSEKQILQMLNEIKELFDENSSDEGVRRIQREVFPRLVAAVHQSEGEELARNVEKILNEPGSEAPSEYESVQASSLGLEEKVREAFRKSFPDIRPEEEALLERALEGIRKQRSEDQPAMLSSLVRIFERYQPSVWSVKFFGVPVFELLRKVFWVIVYVLHDATQYKSLEKLKIYDLVKPNRLDSEARKMLLELTAGIAEEATPYGDSTYRKLEDLIYARSFENRTAVLWFRTLSNSLKSAKVSSFEVARFLLDILAFLPEGRKFLTIEKEFLAVVEDFIASIFNNNPKSGSPDYTLGRLRDFLETATETSRLSEALQLLVLVRGLPVQNGDATLGSVLAELKVLWWHERIGIGAEPFFEVLSQILRHAGSSAHSGLTALSSLLSEANNGETLKIAELITPVPSHALENTAYLFRHFRKWLEASAQDRSLSELRYSWMEFLITLLARTQSEKALDTILAAEKFSGWANENQQQAVRFKQEIFPRLMALSHQLQGEELFARINDLYQELKNPAAQGGEFDLSQAGAASLGNEPRSQATGANILTILDRLFKDKKEGEEDDLDVILKRLEKKDAYETLISFLEHTAPRIGGPQRSWFIKNLAAIMSSPLGEDPIATLTGLDKLLTEEMIPVYGKHDSAILTRAFLPFTRSALGKARQEDAILQFGRFIKNFDKEKFKEEGALVLMMDFLPDFLSSGMITSANQEKAVLLFEELVQLSYHYSSFDSAMVGTTTEKKDLAFARAFLRAVFNASFLFEKDPEGIVRFLGETIGEAYEKFPGIPWKIFHVLERILSSKAFKGLSYEQELSMLNIVSGLVIRLNEPEALSESFLELISLHRWVDDKIDERAEIYQTEILPGLQAVVNQTEGKALADRLKKYIDSRTLEETEGASLGILPTEEVKTYSIRMGRAGYRSILKIAGAREAGGITDEVLYLPQASVEVKDWYLKALAVNDQAQPRVEVQPGVSIFNRDLTPFFQYLQRAVPEWDSSTEASQKLPVILSESLLVSRTGEEAEKAATIARAMRSGDLLIALWNTEKKPAVIGELYKAANGKFRMRDLNQKLATPRSLRAMIRNFQTAPLSIGDLSGNDPLEWMAAEGSMPVRFDLEILKQNGVDPSQVIALLRQLSDDPDIRRELFLQAGLIERSGYWEVGQGFVQRVLQTIYAEHEAQETLAKAA